MKTWRQAVCHICIHIWCQHLTLLFSIAVAVIEKNENNGTISSNRVCYTAQNLIPKHTITCIPVVTANWCWLRTEILCCFPDKVCCLILCDWVKICCHGAHGANKTNRNYCKCVVAEQAEQSGFIWTLHSSCFTEFTSGSKVSPHTSQL